MEGKFEMETLEGETRELDPDSIVLELGNILQHMEKGESRSLDLKRIE